VPVGGFAVSEQRVSRIKAAAVAVVVAAASVTFAAAPAAASTPSSAGKPSLRVVKTLASNYVGPLQFAVAGPLVFVADSFTSTLNLVGRSKPIATGPMNGGDIAGVAVDPSRLSLAYTSSNADHSTTRLTILRAGRKTVVANLSRFERIHNPDGRIQYGVAHPSKCVRNALTKAGIPVNYTGQIDSHPYAVTALRGGAWAVADAGGNDLVKVDRTGHVTLLSVLPRQALHVTPQFAAAQHLPDCVIGITYYFEAVPTDVEIGHHGELLVTTLPGGIGVAGSVYRIDRWTGKPSRIATGFDGATNLAVDRWGHVFVAEINSGTISEIVRGHRVQVGSLPGVVALEYANGHLYASTAPAASGGQGPGTIVVLGR
jgi:DNA-binding beta-propeller fold protein YncE